MCVLHLEPAVKEERSNAARRRGVYVSNFVLNMVLISDDICSNCSFGLKTEMGITRSAAASQQFAYCSNGGRVKKQRFSLGPTKIFENIKTGSLKDYLYF